MKGDLKRVHLQLHVLDACRLHRGLALMSCLHRWEAAREVAPAGELRHHFARGFGRSLALGSYAG